MLPVPPPAVSDSGPEIPSWGQGDGSSSGEDRKEGKRSRGQQSLAWSPSSVHHTYLFNLRTVTSSKKKKKAVSPFSAMTLSESWLPLKQGFPDTNRLLSTVPCSHLSPHTRASQPRSLGSKIPKGSPQPRATLSRYSGLLLTPLIPNIAPAVADPQHPH